MPPPKRKRSDRASVDVIENRPSPHRPGNASLAQDRGSDMREGGNRRSSRGNQGGNRGRRPDREQSDKLTVSSRATPTPGPMSPPAQRTISAAQTPIATPTIEPPAPIHKPDPAPFFYEFLTDERLAAWGSNGRQEVTKLGSQARQDEDATDLSTAFQEFIRAALDGRINPDEAGACVKEILGPERTEEESDYSFDPYTYLLDILSMMCDGVETQKNPALKKFVAASSISHNLMRRNLDGILLQNLGITRETFVRVGIRQATHLLYRQANYNLLREETEGYSKLITELFTTCGSEPPSSEAVDEAFERVKGLIGTFDLDVGRVLDITLDVFAATLIKHFRFFIKLLRVSSWWPRNGEVEGAAAGRCGGLPAWALPSSPGWMPTPEDEELSSQRRFERDTQFWPRAREVGLDAFFELGGRQMVDDESRKRIFGDKKESDATLDTDREWIEATGTYPPSGNRVAAQLLGFKLRFYASAARDETDVLPPNLIYLTALLIKIGFISLRDLYPHLWPLDKDMAAVREAKRKELQEKERLNRPGGGTNALMMAGALADDTLPSSGRNRENNNAKPEATSKPAVESTEKIDLPEPLDQKVQLLTCLLTIGALPESLFILGRFPWLPEAYPELLDLINRILNHSIKDIYELTRPITAANVPAEVPTKNVADVEQHSVPKGQVRLTPIPVRKQLRWPFPDKFDSDSSSYRFYWDEWADNVPVCQSVDDLFTLCSTLLNYSGVGIGKDPVLLSKLARIGAKSLTEDRSKSNLDRWQDLLKRLLVPALSLTKSNTSIVNEIYDLLRFYPVSVRYSIYAEWFEGQISRLPVMKAAFARTTTETQSIMKRISMTNLTTMARSLAKAAYASPGIVFRVALGQIEAYTNLTEVVVECAKYFTDLGYDVLVWSLMSSLGGKDRNRNNAEFALLPSRWLLALARFSGKVFKRYSIMNITPVLQYVNDQLYRGNSTDLVILKELMAQMAGIVPNTDFTDAQISAMTGRELLKRQTLISLQDLRYESVKTSKRLMKALTDTRLAGELLISITQHRQAAIYAIPDSDAHIKLLATMIDDTQLILFQYLDLLRSSLTVEEFDKQVPAIIELLTSFGLQPSLAFMISRVSILSQMANVAPVTSLSQKDSVASLPKVSDADGDTIMNNGSEESTIVKDEVLSSPPLNNVNTTVNVLQSNDGSPPTSATNIQPVGVYNEIFAPIISTLEATLPDDSFKFVSSEFYVTFWVLGLGEVSLPERSYMAEIQRLTNLGERKAAQEAKAALVVEYTKLMADFLANERRILKRKSHWFSRAKPEFLHDDLLEKCLLPRVLLSPADAEYAYKMVKLLHDNSVPHFRTLSLYVQLFKAPRLRSIIFTCTLREAENFGRFLKLILTDLARWHADSAVYEKEAWGKNKTLLGFAKALDSEGKPKGFISHEDRTNGFRNILFNWHKNLHHALNGCLQGSEWMHIRNAITILKTLGAAYPAVNFMGEKHIVTLAGIATKEKGVREDLALTGNAVLVQLKKLSKNWVPVQAFGIPAPEPNGTLSRVSSRVPTNSKTTLKPTAPEFKPSSRPTSTGTRTPKNLNSTEVEDGEVDDAKALASTASAMTNTTNVKEEIIPATAVLPVPETKKSEVLLRREQILRENAAKAAASQSGVNNRSDLPRNHAPNSMGLGDRGPHNLPSRPDAPFPSHSELDRPPRHGGERRDGRDLRIPEPSRTGRPGDRSGGPRDFYPGDRRGVEPNSRDFPRPPERTPNNERERARIEPPPRWVPDSARENADRAGGNRGIDHSGRLQREPGMPPPRPSASSDRGPPPIAERLPPVNSERQELINPERAALMSNSKDSPRSDSPRRGREDGRDRVSSRTHSPRRHTMDKDQSEPRRDERASRIAAVDPYNSSHGRLDDTSAPPAGPRSERQSDRPVERPGNDRPPFHVTPGPARSIDPDHGRLNATPRQYPDPSYGRLNPAPQTPDIPSGPRDRNPRGPRIPNPTAPHEEPRVETPRPPTPDKQPPTGPASNRNARRTVSGQFNISSTPGSTPSTPASASPVVGLHPDRAKQFGQQTHTTVPQLPLPPIHPPPPVNTPVSAGMHPERARAYVNENASPMNPPMNSRGRQSIPPLVTSGPPSGPKGSQGSPVVPGTNGMSAPTGPASATERAQRGVGGRRQLSNINTMLQSVTATPDRFQVRGRGSGRFGQNGVPDTPISGPSTPIQPPPGSILRQEPSRDMVNPERVDLITGTPSNEDQNKDRSARPERSRRHSRRSSRSPGRERESNRGNGEDERPPREHRERRASDRGEPDKERHPDRGLPQVDLMAGREVRGGARESGRDHGRERSDRDPRRSGGGEREAREPPEANWAGPERAEHRPPARGERVEHRGSERRGGGGGRSNDFRAEPNARGGDPRLEQRVEERRDGRGSRDDGGGRKRHSEEGGGGMDSRGREKRVRR